MSCPHLETIACLVAPEPSQVVQREECTQCFDSQDLPLGIEVCLSCFNGACSEPVKHHAQTHISRLGHKFTLNVKRKPRPSSQRTGDEEPPTKITKLAIVDKDEDDMYETSVVVKCWACEPERGHRTMRSFSAAHQAEIQSWRWVPPCVHTLTLKPTSTPIPAARLRQCGLCDLKENLWLCLICGSVGCGRRQYDGSGGNGHALQHWNSSMHTVCIKLGTITPEGNAGAVCVRVFVSEADAQ
ncbi:hypothetical protein C0992_009164 [Termitomyces sp. T32_za158]|nr:hypothetical protein C0992_009164 [Termitomyces sp. T32_za158]